MLFLDALHKKNIKRPPTWIMRQAGRYLPEYQALRKQEPNFLQFCLNPDLATEATLQPIKRYNFDAAILFADILTIPDALGLTVNFVEGKGPVVEKHDIHNNASLKNNVPNVAEHLSNIFTTVKQVRGNLDPAKALIGFSGAPFTVACYTLDGAPSKDNRNLRKLAYTHPDLLTEYLTILADASISYLQHQIDAGADVVQLFESWASIAPPEFIDMLVINPITHICKALNESHPDTPVIIFPRGLNINAIKRLQLCVPNVKAVGVDYHVPSQTIADELQGTTAVQGNLDPAILLTTPEIVRHETQKMLDVFMQKPGYIANLGHGIVPETPLENVSAFVKTIFNWYG